jgi:hypothetical protein
LSGAYQSFFFAAISKITDNRLSVGLDVDMLDAHILRTARPQPA